MSQPETTALTELQEMRQEMTIQSQRLMELTDAVNGMGANLQWIIENAQGIFQMFQSPAFRSMIPMMGGMADGGNSAGPQSPGA